MMRRLQGAYQAQRFSAGIVFAAVVWPGLLAAEPVAVRYSEGSVHGFLVLRTLDDKLLADGDVTQTVDGDRVTARLVFSVTCQLRPVSLFSSPIYAMGVGG